MSHAMYQTLHHQPLHWLYIAAICALALYVLLASACRVYKLNPGQHKLGWRLMYVAFAAYPALLIGYVLTYQPSEELLTVLTAGLVGLALNLALTHAQWATNNVAAIARLDYKPRPSPPAFADAQFDPHHAAQANAQAEARWGGYKKGDTP
jgi:hypothetical protein